MTFSANGEGNLPTDLGPRMRAGLTEAGELVGHELVRKVQDGMLNGPKSGRIYPGLPNQSSAPGEYSANQSGDLLGSFNYRMGGDYVSFYSDGCDHAGYQEFGTSKMAPRPNMEMAITESDEYIRQIIEQIVWRSIGGGG